MVTRILPPSFRAKASAEGRSGKRALQDRPRQELPLGLVPGNRALLIGLTLPQRLGNEGRMEGTYQEFRREETTLTELPRLDWHTWPQESDVQIHQVYRKRSFHSSRADGSSLRPPKHLAKKSSTAAMSRRLFSGFQYVMLCPSSGKTI